MSNHPLRTPHTLNWGMDMSKRNSRSEACVPSLPGTAHDQTYPRPPCPWLPIVTVQQISRAKTLSICSAPSHVHPSPSGNPGKCLRTQNRSRTTWDCILGLTQCQDQRAPSPALPAATALAQASPWLSPPPPALAGFRFTAVTSILSNQQASSQSISFLVAPQCF